MALTNSTQARIVAAQQRESRALELRRAGWSYEAIGRDLGVTRQAAHAAVRRAINRLNLLSTEDAEVVYRLERERLDALQVVVWPRAMDGDLGAIDRCLRIIDQRCKLNAFAWRQL